MIRDITITDLPQIFSLCDRVNDQMEFGSMGHPYSSRAMKESWRKIITDFSGHIFFCHATDSDIDGIFLARMQSSSYFSEGHKVAYEIALHADPALNSVKQSRVTLAIMREAEKRMQQNGVKSFFMSTHPHKHDMDKNMTRHGYRCISRYYVKELQENATDSVSGGGLSDS